MRGEKHALNVMLPTQVQVIARSAKGANGINTAVHMLHVSALQAATVQAPTACCSHACTHKYPQWLT